ncbi:hypothetical protein BKA62DRAFT_765096 [Auriculariales sp. MPI-PUGE-AT-0066]|nr:hypothetical protein BKA62DRAFT_765096 [Auriculariales sp. MPI-PUGE-AT-0066]
MSSRLASFNAPSTPTQSPVRQHSSSAASPRANNSRNSDHNSHAPVESPFHRRLRALLLDIRSAIATWDDIVLHDGFRAAKAIVDTRTQLDNALAIQPLPRERLVSPKIVVLDVKAEDLAAALHKLASKRSPTLCLFYRLTACVDTLETLVNEAHKQKGWTWVSQQPLWNTWTLLKFALEIPVVLPFYDRALRANNQLASKLRDYGAPFEDSRAALALWISQPELQSCPWSDWDQLFAVEIDRWPSSQS